MLQERTPHHRIFDPGRRIDRVEDAIEDLRGMGVLLPWSDADDAVGIDLHAERTPMRSRQDLGRGQWRGTRARAQQRCAGQAERSGGHRRSEQSASCRVSGARMVRHGVRPLLDYWCWDYWCRRNAGAGIAGSVRLEINGPDDCGGQTTALQRRVSTGEESVQHRCRAGVESGAIGVATSLNKNRRPDQQMQVEQRRLAMTEGARDIVAAYQSCQQGKLDRQVISRFHAGVGSRDLQLSQ